MAKTKDIHVNRLSFIREFLDSLIAFNNSNEFLPIYIYNGKLVTVCSFAIKGNAGTIGLNVEHTPKENNIPDGEVFFIQDPVRLKKLAMIMDSEDIHLRFNKSQIVAVGGDFKFTCSLYDPLLANRNNRFWKPEKFAKLREDIPKGISLTKEVVNKIKGVVSATTEDLAVINTFDDRDYLTLNIGDVKTISGGINIPYEKSDKCFTDGSAFNKNLFSVISRGDVEFTETIDGRIMVIIEKTEYTHKYCIITKVKTDD